MRKIGLAFSIVAGVLASSGSAHAQDDPSPAAPTAPTAQSRTEPPPTPPEATPEVIATPEDTQEQQEQQEQQHAPETAVTPAQSASDDIVVTGSRIRRKDLAGPSPIIVLTREQILASGRTNIGEFLQTLPEQANSTGRGTNNTDDAGAIRFDLRGIGPRRTLVLLNGRRLAPGGLGANESVDLSSIPTQLIERIEVLKDGASAIYGSDAIAGVANIITRKRFNGMEVNAFTSATTARDGAQVDVNAIAGSVSDKGGVLFSMGYFHGAPVWSGNREYAKIARGLDLSGGGAGVPYQLGSATPPGGTIQLAPGDVGVQNGNALYNSVVRSNPAATTLTRDLMTGQWRAFRGADLPADGGDGWNYQPYNYLYTPQERFNIFASGDYQLDENVRLFFDSFYTKRNSTQTLAPEPLNLDDEGITVSAANVYNPFGRDFDGVNRRLVEFGRRTSEQDVHTFHLAAGLDGDLPASAGLLAGWFWEVAFNYSRDESTEVKTGNLRGSGLRAAVGPSFVDASGAPRCGTADAIIEDCVPLNLFGGPGSITQEQVTRLTFTGVQRGYNELIGGQANASGDLFHLWSERAAALAVGYEFRALRGGQIPDPITVAGEATGSKGLITKGSYSVHEIYGEFKAPIVEKRPALHALELLLAARGSFYSNFGDTFNYKLGGRWAPTPDVALRGTYSTAFRAPTISELYQGAADNFANVTDPCAAVEPGSALARSCGAAGNNGEPANQLRSHIGGNAQLRPEKAKIFTLGVVFTPRAIKNLTFTLDYFNTKIAQRINGIGEATILQGCYPSAEGVAPKYCQYVARNPVTQRITLISNLDANVGEDRLDGIDMSGNYQLDSAAGRFSLSAAVAYLRRYDRTLADGTLIHGAGTFDLNESGTGGAFPHFRANAGLDWALGRFSAGLRTYLIGSYKECGDGTGDLSGSGLCYLPEHLGERWVDASSTWDVVFGYGFGSSAGRTTLSVGANNIFNAAPPRVYNGFGSTTDTYAYDIAMRVVYARIGHQF